MSNAQQHGIANDAATGDAALQARAMPEFFVSTSASLQERRSLTLKHGDTFGLFNQTGDALAGPTSPEGIFHRDTRHLSKLFLTLEGLPPLLLSSTVRYDNSSLICDLTNSTLRAADGSLLLAQDLFHLRRVRFLWDASALERLALHNFDREPARLRLRIDFASDFADLFEVRGARRPARGTIHPPEVRH